MMPGKIFVKKGLTRLFSASRLFAAVDRHRLREKAFVLMYHRVLRPYDLSGLYIQPGMYVTAESFEKQMVFLKKRYRFLFLEDLIGKIKKGDDIGGCCAITFDDGWRDNFLNAFPILKKYQIPATIFLATSFIGTNRLFWPEEVVSYLDGKSWLTEVLKDSPPCVAKFRRQIEKSRSEGRETFLNQVIEVLKKYLPEEREAILESFRKKGRAQDILPQMMTWEDAGAMGDSGLVAFGAHTVGHEILDQLCCVDARNEILRSREEIRRRLGGEASIFAYPNGNFNETVKRILQEGDFVGAVTTKKGFLSRDTPLLEIPRIGIHEDISDTISMFQGRILLETF